MEVQLPYTPWAFTQVLADHSVFGSVGDAYDNAPAESFVDSFKTELIADREIGRPQSGQPSARQAMTRANRL